MHYLGGNAAAVVYGKIYASVISRWQHLDMEYDCLAVIHRLITK